MAYNWGMIARHSDAELVLAALKRSRVVALLGPRQCGKTTLARRFVPADSLNYFDLEEPEGLARLSAGNRLARSRDWWSLTKSNVVPISSRCCGSWPTAGRCRRDS